MKVGILDYGVGNLGSVTRALEELHTDPILIRSALDIKKADSLILPGVGGFSECKYILDQGGWTNEIREQTLVRKKPLLGICLGMQLLADSGTEGATDGGSTQGLGLISGTIQSLKNLDCKNRIPHVGWNSISHEGNNFLMNEIPSGTDFYFVHSYAFVPKNSEDVIATTSYGIPITAVVGRDNIWGVQFHPEKSSKAGFRIIHNFLKSCKC